MRARSTRLMRPVVRLALSLALAAAAALVSPAASALQLLVSTSDKLQLTTSSTAGIDVHCSYIDRATSTFTPGRKNTQISSATTTDIVLAPGSGVERNVKNCTMRNTSGSTTNTVTLKHTDGTTTVERFRADLAAGETLQCTDEEGCKAYLVSGALKTSFDPNNVAITGGSISGVTVNPLAAGTTAKAPFAFASGTLKTSPASGELEYDGVVYYTTPITSERGVLPSEQWLGLTATYTLTSQTAAQKLFNTPTNGALTVGGSRTYQFECNYDLSSMSATSGSFGFALGGTATLTSVKWWSYANKAALATAAAPQATMNTTASNTTIATATTNTVGWAHIIGIVRVNAGGTIIPQVSLGVAAAAVVGVNSFCRFVPEGTNTTTSVGNWS
jgi:hypothetical protein